ncbi:MAG: hypothetical protein QM820_13640 [Minicystis sp.]
MFSAHLTCSAVLFATLAACTPSSSGPDQQAHSAAATVSIAPVAAAAAVDLVPGTSIGPVRVGMTRAEIDALGLPTKPGPLTASVTVGPYLARFDGDRVASVIVELRDLPAGVRVGGATFDGTAKIEAIAAKLQGCGAVQHNEGASVITCDGGRTLVIAGGPPGLPSIEVLAAEHAAKVPPQNAVVAANPSSEATWKHPGMAMTFSYPDKLLKVSPKPDGATLVSEVLGKIEDRSDQGKDRPSPLKITISVRAGALLDVIKSSGIMQVNTLFPGGTEASFKEEKDFSERITVAGSKGYSALMGSHDVWQEVVYAQVAPRWTLEVTCDYVGDTFKPKVSLAVQSQACHRVLSTLALKL